MFMRSNVVIEKEDIKNLFSKLAAFSQLHNVPVIVGECGADYKGNEVTRKAYVEHYFSNASEYEIKSFAISVANSLKLFSSTLYISKVPSTY